MSSENTESDKQSLNRSNRQENSTYKNSEQNTKPTIYNDLEQLAPSEGVELYLGEREHDLRETSLRTHRSALGFFTDWCTKEDIEDLNTVTGRDLNRYRIWRRDEAPIKTDKLSKQSEKTQQDILRQFVRFCESIDGVVPGLHEKVRSPTVSDDESARSDTIDQEQAEEVSRWLHKYEYASLEHALWALLVETGARIGSIVGLDIDDYRGDSDPPHLRVRHRPDQGTGLKNGENGERILAISKDVCTILDDYIRNYRVENTDEYGREPLLTTSHGRIAKSTVRSYVYRWTRPCAVGNECPHGRDLDDCEATSANGASKCPSSKSPHAIRRGYISHELSSGVDRSFISGRCNVTEEVLKKHYDARDEYQKMEVRRREMANARREHDSYGGN